MPWVHVDDAVACILWALDGDAAGAFNVTAPGAAGLTQAAFAEAVAAHAGRRLQASVPMWAIRLRYGAGIGPAVGGGQELDGTRLAAAGFRFVHPSLDGALSDLVRP